ncbi:L-idonate 5-dehydrogenase [Luteococcus sp. Sow4_B9]|uniref:L-idonate 5-dehydrogenase n=1 Tax=Luteococcus sp. Sow4_B9 TaxID=3438792 RepID=UPI003F9E3281
MKAVVVHAANDLRVDEVPRPQCRPGHVLVAMEWGGICGSDVAYVRTGTSGTAVLKDPLILGHEVSGRVTEVGDDVVDIRIGQAVTVHPATLVGQHQLHNGLAGRTNLWPQVRYFGSAAFDPHEQGGFSEFRAVRADQVRALPEGVTTRQGALAEPFGVALHAVARAGDLAGATVLVNGAGPIGALAVAAARARGARTVYATDLVDAPLRIARQLGADATFNIAASATLPDDVDIVIEASGSPRAIGSVFQTVRRGGTVVQVGNLPAGEISAALGQLVTREITYTGSYRFVDEISDALRLMAEGLDVSAAITHEFPLEEASEAFAVAADRSTGSSKVLLKLS